IIITLVIMYFGRNLGLTTVAGLLGVGFLFKAFIFMIVIWRIKDAAWLDGTVAFLTIVVAVLGTSIVEAITVVKGRVPHVDPEAECDSSPAEHPVESVTSTRFARTMT